MYASTKSNDAFTAGAVSVALAIADCRSAGLFIDNADAMKLVLDTVLTGNTTDRKVSKASLINKINVRMANGGQFAHPASVSHFADDIEREYCK